MGNTCSQVSISNDNSSDSDLKKRMQLMQFNDDAERVNILGVGISALNLHQAIDIIVDWIEHRQKQYVCVTPAHGIMECQRNANLRRIFNCTVSRLYTPFLALAGVLSPSNQP